MRTATSPSPPLRVWVQDYFFRQNSQAAARVWARLRQAVRLGAAPQYTQSDCNGNLRFGANVCAHVVGSGPSAFTPIIMSDSMFSVLCVEAARNAEPLHGVIVLAFHPGMHTQALNVTLPHFAGSLVADFGDGRGIVSVSGALEELFIVGQAHVEARGGGAAKHVTKRDGIDVLLVPFSHFLRVQAGRKRGIETSQHRGFSWRRRESMEKSGHVQVMGSRSQVEVTGRGHGSRGRVQVTGPGHGSRPRIQLMGPGHGSKP